MKTLTFIPLLSLAIGCCCPPPEKLARQPDWKLKTESMEQVVNAINANNSKVPTLWAHHYYEADVIDDKGHSHHAAGDGVLLYISPISMRLRGNAVVGNIFEIGSNPRGYWLKLGPEAGDTMWWGTYAGLAKLNPDQLAIPIRPDMVLDVLGIAMINNNFNVLPAPTMRYDPYADAYVFIWNGKLPSRWVALREVWYDRATKLPELVQLYDTTGRIVLRAEFNNPASDIAGRPVVEKQKYYRQVAVEGLPKDQWPWIPQNYTLFFPDSGSRLVFTLDEATLKYKTGKTVAPVPSNFQMPDPNNADVGRVIQIGGDNQ